MVVVVVVVVFVFVEYSFACFPSTAKTIAFLVCFRMD
jgi:hypothetical protein